jgi:predicted enzyme related to lactoylglutathione lyase
MERIAINYIEFTCRNIPAIKSFYSNAFGWTFTDYGDDYTAFEDGKLSGGFHRSEAVSAPGGNPLVILYTPELEAVCEQVKASGGTIVQEIFSFPGGRRFHFSDPDGNILAVWGE